MKLKVDLKTKTERIACEKLHETCKKKYFLRVLMSLNVISLNAVNAVTFEFL